MPTPAGQPQPRLSGRGASAPKETHLQRAQRESLEAQGIRSKSGELLKDRSGKLVPGGSKAPSNKNDVAAGPKKLSDIEQIRLDQKAAAEKVEGIFRDFKGPKETAADFKKSIGGIKKIDTSKFSNRAAGDINALRKIGNTKGLTQAGKALTAQQRAEQGIGIEQADLAGSQAAQSAFEGLASRGGASAASSERLLGQTGQQSIQEQQALRRSGAAQRLGISSQDEASKLGILGGLSAQEVAVGGLAGKSQEAEAAQALARANAAQSATQFDVGGQQDAARFSATGQGNAIQTGSGQATQFQSAQLLADAQRRAGQGGGGGNPIQSLFSTLTGGRP